MIIVRLSGGLGNQLFQYALGWRLAHDRGVDLKLDLGWFQKQTLRHYQLGELAISASPASSRDVEAIAQTGYKGWLGRVDQALEQYKPYYHRRVIREKDLSFDPIILQRVPQQAYLIGYWQSEKYFSTVADHLRQEIRLKEPYPSDYQHWARKIAVSMTCSLHVRHGDHINDPKTRKVHGVCSLEYYEKAVGLIRERFPAITIFVFSDDANWARAELGHFAPIEFVQLSGPSRDHEELFLMSACSHHIIANSSYSWWGAWLNPSPVKVVIAPQQWGVDSAWVPGDLIPHDWIRL